MPTYVLSKLKRSIATDKVGDLTDQEHPTDVLTTLASNDELVVLDVDGTTKTFKVITRSSFMTWLNALVAPTWAKITGRPSAFTPSAHTHSAAEVVSGVFDSDRIPNVPQLLVLPDPADRTITEDAAYTATLPAATGGTSGYTYTLTGTLPPGLSFVAGTRVLSGTPTAVGQHELTYAVADAGVGASGQTASHTFTVVVQPAGSRYIFVSPDRTISTTEIANGEEHAINEQNLVLPTWTGNRYIGIAQPAAQPDLTRISLAGLGNSISDFYKASYTRTVGGLDDPIVYEIWASEEQQGQAISGEVIEVRP